MEDDSIQEDLNSWKLSICNSPKLSQVESELDTAHSRLLLFNIDFSYFPIELKVDLASLVSFIWKTFQRVLTNFEDSNCTALLCCSPF